MILSVQILLLCLAQQITAKGGGFDLPTGWLDDVKPNGVKPGGGSIADNAVDSANTDGLAGLNHNSDGPNFNVDKDPNVGKDPNGNQILPSPVDLPDIPDFSSQNSGAGQGQTPAQQAARKQAEAQQAAEEAAAKQAAEEAAAKQAAEEAAAKQAADEAAAQQAADEASQPRKLTPEEQKAQRKAELQAKREQKALDKLMKGKYNDEHVALRHLIKPGNAITDEQKKLLELLQNKYPLAKLLSNAGYTDELVALRQLSQPGKVLSQEETTLLELLKKKYPEQSGGATGDASVDQGQAITTPVKNLPKLRTGEYTMKDPLGGDYPTSYKSYQKAKQKAIEDNKDFGDKFIILENRITPEARVKLQQKYECTTADGTGSFDGLSSLTKYSISRGVYKGNKLDFANLFPNSPSLCKDKSQTAEYQHFGTNPSSGTARTFYRILTDTEYNGLTNKDEIITLTETKGERQNGASGPLKVKGVQYMYCGVATHPGGSQGNSFIPCTKL